MTEQTVYWTFTHTCWSCFTTVHVVDGTEQPHTCQPRTCDVEDCGHTAVGMILAGTHHPDTLVEAATPGAVLLCDRHWNTAPAHWEAKLTTSTEEDRTDG